MAKQLRLRRTAVADNIVTIVALRLFINLTLYLTIIGVKV